jgi:endonuclease/exonuclease/phosphatase family metal-dependent hydrolase
VFAVHASWPVQPGSAARRNRELAHIARLAQARSTPLVVLGGLNISPFSPRFGQLLADSGLRSAAEGFGWQPTWPAFLPPAGIQIDHELVSAGIAVRSFRRGPTDGSDHRPSVADLVL